MAKSALIAAAACCAAWLTGCAATTPGYRTPEIRGDQPAVVVMRQKGMGAGCLATMSIDGKVVGTVAAGETLHVPVQPGKYFLRWDSVDGGLCGQQQGLAQKVVTVVDGPVIAVLQVTISGKAWIPLVGLTVSPEYHIIVNGDDS